jgi:hypothetical protein
MAKSRRGAHNGLVPHRGKVLRGKHAAKAVSYDPSVLSLEAAAAAFGRPIVDRKRPALSRYAIDMKTYNRLKDEAAAKARPLPRPESALVLDKAKKGTPELATAAPAALAPLAAAPTAAPTGLTNFQGIAATGWFPPDCTLAAGPSHVLAAVNSWLALYPKNGGAPAMQRDLSTWFSNVITNAKVFDPRVAYDQYVGRWIVLADALPLDVNDHSSWFLISVSKTSDPLGGWFNYKLDAKVDGSTTTDNWADYPGLGLDSEAVYVTANMFKFGGFFQYAKLRVIPKASLYAGGTVNWFDYTKLKNKDGSSCFTIQPCHMFGAPGTQYFVNSVSPTSAAPTQDTLSLWSLPNPTAGGTITRRDVSVDRYGMPPDADQKGGGRGLNTGDVRMLNAVFRGGSIWAALTTSHDWGDGQSVAAMQWLQINATSGALVQQGIFGAKKLHYFYPAVMPDANGNMTVVFCRSGAGIFASISYTGRHASDPVGSLQGSAQLKGGLSHYNKVDDSGRNRWGDYSGIAIDPNDSRTTWFYSMFAHATADTWGTWVGSSRF